MCLEGGFSGSTSLVVTNCTHDLYVSREDISQNVLVFPFSYLLLVQQHLVI